MESPEYVQVTRLDNLRRAADFDAMKSICFCALAESQGQHDTGDAEGLLRWIEVNEYECLVSKTALASGCWVDQAILKHLEDRCS